MKIRKFCWLIGLVFPAFSSNVVYAQQKISADVAYSQNFRNSSPGLNLSTFYHFNERVSVGLELNRFFKHIHWVNDEEITLSAWDVDLNFHYNILLSEKLFFYPLAGISHTAELEENGLKGETERKFFYSFNTGTGFFLVLNKITPFVECMFTWGELNQRFLLLGIGYEFDLKRKHK